MDFASAMRFPGERCLPFSGVIVAVRMALSDRRGEKPGKSQSSCPSRKIMGDISMTSESIIISESNYIYTYMHIYIYTYIYMYIIHQWNYWLVVWNMAYDFPCIGNNHPNWLSYFSRWSKPPTSIYMTPDDPHVSRYTWSGSLGSGKQTCWDRLKFGSQTSCRSVCSATTLLCRCLGDALVFGSAIQCIQSKDAFLHLWAHGPGTYPIFINFPFSTFSTSLRWLERTTHES